MKIQTILLLTVIVLLCSCGTTTKSLTSWIPGQGNPADVDQPGKQTEREFEKEVKTTLSLKYLLFLPEDYEKYHGEWPLMLFLHGAGERGDDLELVKKHGPPKIVETQPDFPFILVSPQCPAGVWWTDKLDELEGLLDEITARYRVDESRVYLTGLSMGGFGTWALGARCPDRFAAIVPICGGGSFVHRHALRRMPTWVFHGAKDNTVPLEESERMVEALRKAGNPEVRFTVYPEAGHDSWTETYDNPELYNWLLEHQRQ